MSETIALLSGSTLFRSVCKAVIILIIGILALIGMSIIKAPFPLILSLIIGSVFMTAAMILWNWLITPIYMGYPRDAVAAMLVPVFLPFNLLKAGLNSAFVLFLYKPLVTALRKTGLVAAKEQVGGSGKKMGATLLGLLLLGTCILLLLVFQGKI